ncbi:MAG TPA: DUF4214 domain-containing protein [Ramlibacter sp.]|nr:DUF4214 domain-containing protein [Ramlibacter sp.]
MKRFAQACVAVLGVAFLCACGGGSGSGGNPSPTAAVSTVNGAATFSGPRNNYTIAATNSGWTVTDHVGSDGVTNLAGTTTSAAFTDFTVNLGIGAKSQTISDSDLKSITELYVAFFNRVPDADGLSYWIDQFKNGMTLSQMCDNFYAAAVFYSNLTGYSSTMSNADFITVIYKNVLGRTSVDASGMNYWSNALATGAATRGTLVESILSSAHTFKGDPTWGWVADLLDNKYTVAKYFAVQEGLNYGSPSQSITSTIAIAAAVTPTSTTAATSLIGVSDTSFTTLGASSITFYIVDGPVKGITYACAPSGKSAVTDLSGAVACQAGDTATLTISTTSGTINLGSIGAPAKNGISMPVTLLANGVQVAEILQALNHGTADNIDVTGTSLPAATVAQINAYIAGAGTLPAGVASDDQFLAGLQAQEPGVAFTSPVTGNGTNFRDNTVLPGLQKTIIGISGTNPPPVLTDGTTKLSGTIVVAGSGTFPIPNCPSGTVTFSGGGILNATVNGDVTTPGAYATNWTSPGFQESVTIDIPQCTIPGNPPIVIPEDSSTNLISTPPVAGNSQLTVTSAFTGTNLSMPAGQAPDGCVLAPIAGTDIGASNPLITLTTSVTCQINGADINATVTAKLVGAW